jgi:PAS domain S-box-containing protein
MEEDLVHYPHMATHEYDQILGKIRSILVGSTKGYTVTEIARKIGTNRNSVAKYLDILVTGGTVEMKIIGSAKLFTLSKRMPLTSIINISSDYILLLDEETNVTYANEKMLRFENSTIDEIVGKPVASLELARQSVPGISNFVSESMGGREILADLEFRKGSDSQAFHAKFVPGLFENNKKGLIIVLGNVSDSGRIVNKIGNNGADSPSSIPLSVKVKETVNTGSLASEKLFRNYIELSQEGILTLDANAKTTFLNKRMSDILGYGGDEIIGKSLCDFLDESGKLLVKEMMDFQSREKSIYRSNDIRFVRKNGTTVNTTISSTPFFDESGAFTGGLAIITDITERKIAENALRQREAYYRTIIEASPNGMVIFDANWKIRMANRQTAKYLGYYDTQSLDGKNIFNFISPEDIEKCQSHLKQILEKKESNSIECKFIRTDSTGFCADFAASHLGRETKETDCFLGVITDITERRKAEALVRKSEIKHRTLVEGLSSIIFTTDQQGKLTYISPVIQRILGYHPEELVGKHFYVLVSSDNRHVLGIKLKEAKNGGSTPFDSQVLDKSGNPHWVRIVAQPMMENNNVVGITGLIGDINDWKLTEDALNQCSIKYKTVVEDQTDLICRFTPDLRISFVNPALCRFFGKKESEILGKNLMDLIAITHRDTLRTTITQITPGIPVKTCELDFSSPIGNPYSYHVTARAIFNPNGEKSEFQISCRDITELKSYFERSQKLLQELQLRQVELQKQNEDLKKLQKLTEISEKRYHDIYDTVPVGNLTLKATGKISAINPSGALLFGKNHDILKGRDLVDFVHDDSREDVVQFVKDLFIKPDRRLCTVRVGSTDENIRQILMVSKGSTAIAGQSTENSVILVDVTGSGNTSWTSP